MAGADSRSAGDVRYGDADAAAGFHGISRYRERCAYRARMPLLRDAAYRISAHPCLSFRPGDRGGYHPYRLVFERTCFKRDGIHRTGKPDTERRRYGDGYAGRSILYATADEAAGRNVYPCAIRGYDAGDREDRAGAYRRGVAARLS